jgi:hypothetical protein
MKTHGRAFLTSALDGGEWPDSTSGGFTAGTNLTGDWVGPRASLDAAANRKIAALVGNRTSVVYSVV